MGEIVFNNLVLIHKSQEGGSFRLWLVFSLHLDQLATLLAKFSVGDITSKKLAHFFILFYFILFGGGGGLALRQNEPHFLLHWALPTFSKLIDLSPSAKWKRYENIPWRNPASVHAGRQWEGTSSTSAVANLRTSSRFTLVHCSWRPRVLIICGNEQRLRKRGEGRSVSLSFPVSHFPSPPCFSLSLSLSLSLSASIDLFINPLSTMLIFLPSKPRRVDKDKN